MQNNFLNDLTILREIIPWVVLLTLASTGVRAWSSVGARDPSPGPRGAAAPPRDGGPGRHGGGRADREVFREAAFGEERSAAGGERGWGGWVRSMIRKMRCLA